MGWVEFDTGETVVWGGRDWGRDAGRGEMSENERK